MARQATADRAALRDLPSVDRLLRAPGGDELVGGFGRSLATEALRAALDAAMLLAAANSDIIIAFLASVVVAVTGLALPLSYYLNKRLLPPEMRHEPPSFLTVIRQALWVGLWVAFCLWLQMNRTLGVAVAALVAAVLILFEVVLQIRARAASVQQQGGP